MARLSLVRRTGQRIRNVILDVRYGGVLYGRIPSRFKTLGANDTENTDYSVLREAFKYVDLEEFDQFVDVGCGKGRVLNFWLHIGITKSIVGVEIDPEIAGRTSNRLSRYPNVRVMACDIRAALPVLVGKKVNTLFYLYNSFTETIVRDFADAIGHHVSASNLRATTLYYNCKHRDAFEGIPELVTGPSLVLKNDKKELQFCTVQTRDPMPTPPPALVSVV